MDVHDRYRTESSQQIEPRFNERFILSLTSNPNCLYIDDEFNLLPITTHMKHIAKQPKQFDTTETDIFLSKKDKPLNELKALIVQLINVCKIFDQAKAIMLMVDAKSEKSSKCYINERKR